MMYRESATPPPQVDIVCERGHKRVVVLRLVREGDELWRPVFVYTDENGQLRMIPTDRGEEVYNLDTGAWEATGEARVPVVRGVTADGTIVSAMDPAAVDWTFDLRCPHCKISPRATGTQVAEAATLAHGWRLPELHLEQIAHASGGKS